MKNLTMRGRGFAIAAIVMMTAVLPVSASAALISSNSEIAMFGTYTPTGGTALNDATGLSVDPSLIAAGANDFAFSVGGNATFLPFDFATGGPIFTFAGGGAFTATSITIDLQTATALDLTMVGVYSLAGFDDTAGNFVLTADALGGLFTYSAVGRVTTPIPVPGALVLMVSALGALGIRRR